mgnify:FL=1|jgi:hypothetical protein
MSVLSCNRRGCSNIMCDRHNHKHGYICDECFKELVSLRIFRVHEFMASHKGSQLFGQGVDFNKLMDEVFPNKEPT